VRLGLRCMRAIDAMSERLGAGVAWLTVAMIALGAWNALARYFNRLGYDLASNAYIEAQWYLFSLVFLFGAAPALREGAHVRVDVIYGRLSRTTRAWIDLLGSLLFLIPFAVVGIVLSWPVVVESWRVLEVSPDPGGLPRFPIKSVIPVALGLLALQGVAEVVRNVARLRGHALAEDADEAETGDGTPGSVGGAS